MTDNRTTTGSRRRKRLAGAAGLLLVGGIAGGALAATTSASAVTAAPTTSAPSAGVPKAPADSAVSVRPGEKAQTGAALASLKAAALRVVPGGTVYRVETDADGSAYEAHMTKADGTHVTVKFDKSLKVTAVEDGMGAGGPGGSGGAAGPGATGGAAGGTAPASSGAGL